MFVIKTCAKSSRVMSLSLFFFFRTPSTFMVTPCEQVLDALRMKKCMPHAQEPPPVRISVQPGPSLEEHVNNFVVDLWRTVVTSPRFLI